MTKCTRCGGLLELRHAAPQLQGPDLRAHFDARWDAHLRALRDRTPAHRWLASGVWRYRELVLPSADDSELLTQPEGITPLVARVSVDTWAGTRAIGAELLLKHEGHNPTGSFKDRGMTVAVTQACRVAASAVACASTGNTSSSLAAYAALAGLPALVFVPAGYVSSGKLAQTLAYGARTLLVRGDFDACLRLASAAAAELGVYLANSVNPFRLEGQKTIVLELLQQLGWEAPDWLVLPAGNLGNTAAFGRALADARALGLIDRIPRLAPVQAAGAAPFAAGFRAGFSRRVAVRPDTVATAIRIGDPASWDRAVWAVRETEGVVLDVHDAEILEAKAAIDASGVGCEPASAASVAGVRRLVREGLLRPGERAVAVLTGHVLKDPGLPPELHGGAGATDGKYAAVNPPVEVDATLQAVKQVLATTARFEARERP